MSKLLKYLAGAGLAALLSSGAQAQVTEIRVGYQPSPVQEASIAMMEKWGAANGIKIVKVPNAYGVYVEKMTAALTSGSDQYDVIWQNDDWGPLWAHLLEPTDDVEGMQYADPWANAGLIFNNEDGKTTTVPMGHTMGAFFYRKDLVKEDEIPKTFDELISVSKRLQEEDKVRYGYVGAASYQNIHFTWLWMMWANNCDILAPSFERDNAKLEANGFKSQLAEPCVRNAAEFWWDAINTHKISPRGMPTYGRDEANAVFMAGDAAFTVADSTYWGTFNDPAKSQVAGNVGIAYFPLGPNRKEHQAWNDIWGWSIPKSISPERKAAAKKMLGAMMLDEEGQIALFKATGSPPPNAQLWEKLAQTDPMMADLKKYVLDVPNKVRSAYYFEKWPLVAKAFADVTTKALTGSREDIAPTLAAGAETVSAAAK